MKFKTIIVNNINRLRIRPMGDISENFSRSEFACRCGCGFATVDVELIKTLEVVRKQFNKPIKINSSCRCEEHNERIIKEESSCIS